MTIVGHFELTVLSNHYRRHCLDADWHRYLPAIFLHCIEKKLTGSAVAFHCCKAHSKINRNMEIRPPVKS